MVRESLLKGYLVGIGLICALAATVPSEYWTSTHEAPEKSGGLFDVDYASRWDGECSGWTKTMTLVHTAGDLLTWLAYLAISRAICLYHPIVKQVKSSQATMLAITFVFMTCGSVHLVNAYSNFYPMYRFAGYYKLAASLVGIAGSVLVTWSLVRAKTIWESHRLHIESVERRRDAGFH